MVVVIGIRWLFSCHHFGPSHWEMPQLLQDIAGSKEVTLNLLCRWRAKWGRSAWATVGWICFFLEPKHHYTPGRVWKWVMALEVGMILIIPWDWGTLFSDKPSVSDGIWSTRLGGFMWFCSIMWNNDPGTKRSNMFLGRLKSSTCV